MNNHTSIKELPISERPYEKFLSLGPESLSDAELLAIIIKNGTKSLTSIDIARELLKDYHGNILNLFELSYDDLLKFEGIGSIKAIQLKTIAELSKRIARTKSGYNLSLHNSETVAEYYMENLRHNKKECFIGAYFDIKSHFIGDSIIATGTYNCAYVEEREVIRIAIEKRASSIIIIHNHPSGDCEPSGADVDVTHRISDKANYFGIELRDHIIIGDNRYFSFFEHRII